MKLLTSLAASDSSFLSHAVDLLGRASLFVAGLLGVALLLAFALRRASARHAFLCAALGLATLAPLWLSLAARAPAATIASRALPGPLEAPLAHALVALAAPPTAQAVVTAAPSSWPRLPTALFALWLGGTALALVRIGHGLARARGLRRRARPVPGPEGFPHPLFVSDEIPAAVVVGLLRPVILVAPTLLEDAGFALVLAHERAHARRRDPLLGLVARLAAAIYWFHPCVHLAVRAIGRAREESCDDAAVAGGDGARYARTLLGLATTMSTGARTLAGRALVGVAHDARTLERRIRRLLAPSRAPSRVLGALAAAGAAALLSTVGAPLALALARPEAPAAPPPPPQDAAAAALTQRAQRLLRAAVPQGEGAFVLQTISDGSAPARTVVINPALAALRLTPASTYKMVIALLGLDAGVIAGPETVLPWDGTVHAMPEWNHAMDLAEAMRTSATWYFQAIERQLQKRQPAAPTLQRLRYGNQAATTPDFWMDGTLAISALEQADFQTRLARAELPVSARARAVLDQVTRLDQRGAAVMFGKSGTAESRFDATTSGLEAGPGVVVWLVGHVESGPRRHAYALVLRAPGSDSRALRARRVALTQELLALHGVWPAEVGSAEASR